MNPTALTVAEWCVMRSFVSASELIQRLASFARDRRGISAVEFAMLLPLMVTMYLGVIEVSKGVAIDRKVTLTTRTMADLASRVTSINNSDMNSLLNASAAVIAPYQSSPLKIVLSAVTIDANGNAKIAWSDTLGGSKRSVGSTVTLPAVLNVPNTQLIWSEVSYLYNPTFGYVLTGNLNLSDQIYMRPRLSDTITRVNS
jgi:Flp pilus assembly protein TadG